MKNVISGDVKIIDRPRPPMTSPITLEQQVEANEQKRIEIAELLVEELKKRYEWSYTEDNDIPYSTMFIKSFPVFGKDVFLSWEHYNGGHWNHADSNSQVYHRYIRDVPVREGCKCHT